MSAHEIIERVVTLVVASKILVPMREVKDGELGGRAPDLSVPQIIREPIIELVNDGWKRFLRIFAGKEMFLRKRVDPDYFNVKIDTAFGSKRFEHCYEKDWAKAEREGTSWVTSRVPAHKNCQLYEACLFVAVNRTWTLWHVDFQPASPSITTLVSGWKLWLVCTQTELARELCRDSGRPEDLLKLLETGGERLKHIQWAIQEEGDSIVLPWGLAHCVITLSERGKGSPATTAMLSYVINGSEDERMVREDWISQRFATNERKGRSHGN